MTVNTSGHAGGTSHSDDIAFFHSVANFYQIFGVMGTDELSETLHKLTEKECIFVMDVIKALKQHLQ